jgi:hypothetical protein
LRCSPSEAGAGSSRKPAKCEYVLWRRGAD